MKSYFLFVAFGLAIQEKRGSVRAASRALRERGVPRREPLRSVNVPPIMQLEGHPRGLSIRGL